jgi:hypothetical protein
MCGSIVRVHCGLLAIAFVKSAKCGLGGVIGHLKVKPIQLLLGDGVVFVGFTTPRVSVAQTIVAEARHPRINPGF